MSTTPPIGPASPRRDQPTSSAPHPQTTPHPATSDEFAPHPAASDEFAPHPAASDELAPHPAASDELAPHPAASDELAPHPAASDELAPHPAASDELAPHPATSDEFDRLMAGVLAGADRFGHREHLQLTWLAVLRHGTAAAIALVSDGIQRTARYHGAPQKYHATISRAWVELVGYHAVAGEDFAAFLDRCPELLDKRLLSRHYRSATLAAEPARRGWVEPDLRPLPSGPATSRR